MADNFFTPEIKKKNSLASEIQPLLLKSSILASEQSDEFKSVVDMQNFPTANEFNYLMKLDDKNPSITKKMKKYSETIHDFERKYYQDYVENNRVGNQKTKSMSRSDLVRYSDTHSKKGPFGRSEQKNIELKLSLLNADLRESINLIGEQFNEFHEETKQNTKRNLKTQLNRLSKMKRQKASDVVDLSCSWDTSASLIRLMQRNKVINVLMNIYIWILMIFRAFYLYLLIEYMVNDKDIDRQLFFWICFGVYFGIRVIFAIIVLKILFYGDDHNDPKIKIVYETYRDIYTQFKVRQNLTITLMSCLPPELSFLFVTSNQRINKSGYYQVQNLIMKSLEVFFFIPFLIYFRHEYMEIQDVINIWKFDALNVNELTTLVLLVDLVLFTLLTIYLLINNQKKKSKAKIN